MPVKNFDFNPEFYDLQVDWVKRMKKEEEFFQKIFKERKVSRVLEIGCGTGHHAQLFSKYAEEVIAIDPAGDMLDYAKKNIIKSPKVVLIKKGFEGLDGLAYKEFDLITSLGNTIALLEGRKKVKQALKKTRQKLSKNGMAVLQFLNFNSDIIEKNRFYPPKVFKKDGMTYIFIKHFEYGIKKTRLDFIITALKNDRPQDYFVNSSFLCTLKAGLFLKMAKNSGFKKIELLGPGGEGPFDPKKHISLYALLYR